MSEAGIVSAAKCLKRHLSQAPIFQAPNVPAPFVSRQRAAAKCTTTDFHPLGLTSMPIKSSGRIVPSGWAPLQPKQSVLSLIV